MVKLNLNISNKTLAVLISVLVLLAVSGIAIGLNSGDYHVHGHTADEIQGGVGGSCAFCRTCGGEFSVERGAFYFQSYSRVLEYGEECSPPMQEYTYSDSGYSTTGYHFRLCCSS